MIATPADQSESGLKDRYRDFQYLAQEVLVLERYNRAVLAEPDKGELRIHSFLALTLMALERFLRMVLDERATAGHTLPNLLEMATARRNRLFELGDREKPIRFVNGTRRVVMHGGLGVTNEAEHLLGYLLPLSLDLFRFTNAVVAAFDAATGVAHPGARVEFLPSNVEPNDVRVVLTPVEELISLNRHNKTYKPGDPEDGLLLFAEGALCMTLVEAAARQWVGDGTLPKGAGFREVLEKAAEMGLRIPFDDPEDGIDRLASVKNSIVHANFEQAAQQASGRDVAAYFKEQYAAEIEAMYQVCLDFLGQVEARDGEAA